jgi:hypothetical protein
MIEWLKVNRPGYFPVLKKAQEEVDRLKPAYEAAMADFSVVYQEIQPELDAIDAELNALRTSNVLTGEEYTQWYRLRDLADAMMFEQKVYQEVCETYEPVPNRDEFMNRLNAELLARFNQQTQTTLRETELRERRTLLETEHRDKHARVYRVKEETSLRMHRADGKLDKIREAMYCSARLIDAYTNSTEYLKKPLSTLMTEW